VTWKAQGADVYTGSIGGGLPGAISGMKGMGQTSSSLAALFLFIVPLLFFKQVAKRTKKYCYDDWVVKKFALKRDGQRKKMPNFVDFPSKLAGKPYPDRNVVSWFAMLILQGGYFGTYKPPAWKLWCDNPYGIHMPYL